MKIVDSASGDARPLLDLSAILRQFLVDDVPLIDVVNRKYRLRLRFTANESTESLLQRQQKLGLPGAPIFMWTGDLGVGRPAILSKDQFLAHTVLYVQGTHYNVRQIIKACANRLGGVHVGNPERDDPDQATVRDFNATVWIGDTPGLFRGLKGIGRMVRDGLRPLRDAIQPSASEPNEARDNSS